ncbi:MAG: hypothetical protein ACRYG8_23360 [Janthinobacterium lividum]
MTPARLIECLTILGWSTTILAHQLDCREELTRRWRAGKQGYSIPDGVADWIERRAAAALADPAPAEWKRRAA